jgi:hypothetical protein
MNRSLMAAAILLAGCARLSEGRPGAAPTGPDAPVTSTPVDPDEPVPAPSPRVVEPRDDLVDVHPQRWDRARVLDDRTVLLVFYGGVEACYGVDRVDVGYGADEVTMTLFTGRVPGADVCIELAELQGVEVALQEPLGDREIADGAR